MDISKLGTSKRKVDQAGATLVQRSSVAQVDVAYDTIASWRAYHAFPSQVLRALLKRHSQRQDEQSLVVNRLKRMRSIYSKLQREPYRLSQMQDIAGVRATVDDVDKVDAIVSSLERSRSYSELVSIDDYISTPRSTGYRSVHLIWKFKSKRHPQYNGMRCEMQVRSIVQNIWASTVELSGFYKGEGFKNGEGDKNWLRLFQLVSALNSIAERRPIVSSVNCSRSEMMDEARELIVRLNAIDWLHGYRATMDPNLVPINLTSGAWYLLSLDSREKTTTFETFHQDQFLEANERYKQEELKTKDEQHRQVALVSAYQYQEMQRAYPSFLGDATAFMVQLELIKNPSVDLDELMKK